MLVYPSPKRLWHAVVSNFLRPKYDMYVDTWMEKSVTSVFYGILRQRSVWEREKSEKGKDRRHHAWVHGYHFYLLGQAGINEPAICRLTS